MWTKEEIGLVIKNTRLTAGLTQAQVAKSLGRPQQTIANWEVGRSQPDANTLFELFKLLGADLNTSFGFFPGRKEEAPPYSDEALKLATDYDSLDEHGQRVVRLVTNEEKSRCEAVKTSAQAGPAEEKETVFFYLPCFLQPSSAGTGQTVGEDPPEEMRLKKEPPKGASYISRVSGDSMEPTYHNGDLIFVSGVPEIRRGQIGIFFMDGQQWVKELGDGVLISHNPKYTSRPFTEDTRCQGLVLGVCDESYLE